jgi:hypothetical protein
MEDLKFQAKRIATVAWQRASMRCMIQSIPQSSNLQKNYKRTRHADSDKLVSTRDFVRSTTDECNVDHRRSLPTRLIRNSLSYESYVCLLTARISRAAHNCANPVPTLASVRSESPGSFPASALNEKTVLPRRFDMSFFTSLYEDRQAYASMVILSLYVAMTPMVRARSAEKARTSPILRRWVIKALAALLSLFFINDGRAQITASIKAMTMNTSAPRRTLGPAVRPVKGVNPLQFEKRKGSITVRKSVPQIRRKTDVCINRVEIGIEGS